MRDRFSGFLHQRIVKVSDLEEIVVDQVLIRSCTNSSFKNLMTTAALLKGKKVHPRVSFGVVAGSRQVLRMITENGALTDIIDSGARILESACGFCVGYGQSPHSGAVSVRTSNRNFDGRSGTKNDNVYLGSPEVAVAAALTGRITDPRHLTDAYPKVAIPEKFHLDDSMFIKPSFEGEVFRGPNVGAPPSNSSLPSELRAIVAIKVGDKVSTDHIIPAGAVSRYRSNVAKSSEYLFKSLTPEFARTCEGARHQGVSPIIVAGQSYGQGSSREHAALCPMYLGVRAVVARSIERVHLANLINFGIIPLSFDEASSYEQIDAGDELEINDVVASFQRGRMLIHNRSKSTAFGVSHSLTSRQIDIVILGGALNYFKKEARA